jgi:hypothetical protein
MAASGKRAFDFMKSNVVQPAFPENNRDLGYGEALYTSSQSKGNTDGVIGVE